MSKKIILTKRKVDEYLNEVNYKTTSYLPSEDALMFANFIREVNGGSEENETPLMHLMMMDSVFNDHPRNAILVHRGGSKTSLFGEYLTLYKGSFNRIPGFGKTNLSLYISDSIENGVKNLRRNVEFRFGDSDYLKYLIPMQKLSVLDVNQRKYSLGDYDEILEDPNRGGIRFTDVRLEFENRRGGRHITKAYGIMTGIKGPLGLNELVYTDNGTRKIKDVNTGDIIIASDGSFTKVLGKSPIFNDPMYELVFADGRKIKVDENHRNPLLQWIEKRTKNGRIRKYEKVEITTKEILKYKLKTGTLSKFMTEIPKPAQYTTKVFELDPYLLGIALGDGNIKISKGLYIGGLKDDVEFYYNELKDKYDISLTYTNENGTDICRMSFHGINKHTKSLNIAGVIGENKFIPNKYLFGDIKQRKKLLAGLLDTDGSCSKDGRISFTNISKQLIDDTVELARSLGYYVSYSDSRKAHDNKKELHRIYLRGSENPFILTRKANLWKKPERFKGRIPLVAINRIDDEPSQCIKIDHPSTEFITTGYMTTFNTKELGQRPVDATFDDIIKGDDAARSAVILQTVKNSIYKDVAKALHPKKRKMIYLGTPYNQNDPLYQAIESGVWTTSVYPICEHFDSTTTKEDFVGSWEDRFPYEYVKDEFDTAVAVGEPQSFYQELMLRVTNEEDRLVKDSDIKWYKSSDEIILEKEMYNFYITTDLATGSNQSSDPSAISVWAYNAKKQWFWVDGTNKKQTVDISMDDLFSFVKKYSPHFVTLERQGSQKGFISLFKREMNHRNEYFAIASDKKSGEEGFTASRDKIQRFEPAIPYFKRDQIFFPENLRDDPRMIEMMNQLKSISTSGISSKHDDLIDTISHIPLLHVFEPTAESIKKAVDKENGLDEEEDFNPFKKLIDAANEENNNKSTISSYIV